MTTLVLPAGSEDADALSADLEAAGHTVIQARRGRPGGPDGGPAWDPLSFVSARSLLIEAEASGNGRLDAVVVFASPPPDQTGLAETPAKDIEHSVLEWSAGHAQLVKEILVRFRERGAGTLVLVVRQADQGGPLSAMASGALSGLAESLAASRGGPWRFLGVHDESGQDGAAGHFVAKLLADPPKDSGKVIRFTGRQGLFGQR